MSVVNLPDASTPIAWVEINGRRIAAEIDQEWMRGFSQLLDRAGGTTSNTITEINIAAFEDAGIAEQQAELQALESRFGQLPPAQPQVTEDGVNDYGVAELRARIAVLETAITGLMQGTVP